MFVCAVAPEQMDEVRDRLASLIDDRTDTVHILPACGACWPKLIVLGQAEREPERPYWAVL